jgi:uncharacterized repeat protein (TIGR03803 family)
MFLLIILATDIAQAQTLIPLFQVNKSDGAGLANGLTADRQGTLYGTAYEGGIQNCPGDQGCGTVFRLSHHGTGWTFSLLYSFRGVSDGWFPAAPVAVAPDGSLYGTTVFGGTNGCGGQGCGTVFRLQPPPTFCDSVSCPWTKTTLYEFTSGLDGFYPSPLLTFDRAGNVYGTASESQENGSVWELSPSNGGWTLSVLYEFTGGPSDVGGPSGGVVFDRSGNLWGTSGFGGVVNCGDPQLPDPCGTIFELIPSGSGWTERTAYGFSASVGGGPTGNLALDQSGNLYGTLFEDGPNGDDGGVFQFNPSSGELTVLYYASGNGENEDGPQGGVVIDQAGDLYAADPYTGGGYTGYVFKLTASNGNWIFTDLHSFTCGSDGCAPYGPLVVDANGNVYGANADQVIFEITP